MSAQGNPPILHHLGSWLEIKRVVISRTDRVAGSVCELQFDVLVRISLLMQNGGSQAPEAMLAYVLTLETPLRFPRSRDVGPYLGLVPRQEDSGDTQPQLNISKAGDRMLRKLLVGSAHYILGPFGPDTDLRRFGKKLYALAERTPRNERPSQWHENSQFCCIDSGSA